MTGGIGAGPGAALVLRAWERFDAGDLGHMDDLFTADARFGSGPGAVTGPDAIAKVVAGHRRPFPQTTHQHVRSLEGDELACVEGRVVALHRGPLPSPVDPISPTGRRIEWLATVWVELSGGKIANWTTSYDTVGVLSQPGAS